MFFQVICEGPPGRAGACAAGTGVATTPFVAPLNSSSALKENSSIADDRRKSPRFDAEQVPWIREVKAGTDAARVVNISRGGVLLETTARLKPGRRSTLIIVGDLDERLRADADVIRTELVSIGSAGELVFRTALAFATEFDLRVESGQEGPEGREGQEGLEGQEGREGLEGQAGQAGLSPVVLQAAQAEVRGPLPAVWHEGAVSRDVQVFALSQVGCRVHVEPTPAVGHTLSLTVLFSPVRALTLRGVVREVVDGHAAVTFSGVSAETARTLRVEIREAMATALAVSTIPAPVRAAALSSAGVWSAQAATLHANQR